MNNPFNTERVFTITNPYKDLEPISLPKKSGKEKRRERRASERKYNKNKKNKP